MSHTYFLNAGRSRHVSMHGTLAKAFTTLERLHSTEAGKHDYAQYTIVRLDETKEDNTLIASSTSADAYKKFKSHEEVYGRRCSETFTPQDAILTMLRHVYGWKVEGDDMCYRLKHCNDIHLSCPHLSQCIFYACTFSGLGITTLKEFENAPVLYPPYSALGAWVRKPNSFGLVPFGWKEHFFSCLTDCTKHVIGKLGDRYGK